MLANLCEKKQYKIILFEKGKKYRFVAKKLFEDIPKVVDDKDVQYWANLCDGKEVNIISNYYAELDGYRFPPEWCEEIKEDAVFE